MSSKAEKDRGKQIEDKCQALLTEMLRDEDNKYCVDCDAKGPRWASWNLGIFLCIRCAGIHRNLGVHISKVKSVNLDTWTPEQVVSLQQMGNSRARAVYEANIPDNFRRPQSDSSLEAFVRAKYEHKKYIAKEWVPTPVPNVKQSWDRELDEEAERQKKRKKELKVSNTRKAEGSTPQMLPKPKSSSSPRPVRSSPIATVADVKNTTPKPSASLDLFFDSPAPTSASGQASATSNGEDIFSSFLSAPPAAAPPVDSTGDKRAEADGGKGRTAEEESFFNQPAPTSQEKRQLTKDSILALYGSAPAPQQQQPGANPLFGIPGGVYTQPSGGFPSQAFGMPNGVLGAPANAGMFNVGAQQPAAHAMASNPFFNMTANPMGMPQPGFGQQSQEHVVLPNASQDLMSDFSVLASKHLYAAQPSQLPQQMGRMNLGGPMGGAPPQGMMGMHQSQPMGMQMPANNAAMNAAFSQANSSGHTLATNLWQ